MTTENVAADIFVSGHVQGVNYRAFTEQEAGLLGLAGYVRNLSDGRVQVAVEGNRITIEELIKVLRKGPSRAHVTDINVSFGPAYGKFTGFTIRY